MNKEIAGVLLFCLVVMTPIMVVVGYFKGDFKRYGGDSGYIYAWRDFESGYLNYADLNSDGEVTRQEFKLVKKDFLQHNGLYTVKSRSQVYSKTTGEKISAEAFVAIFKEDLKTPREIKVNNNFTGLLKDVLIQKLNN